jgi:flagellar biosynthesis/type III secretory pathway protein FliH
MDSFPETEFYEKGYQDGIEYGAQKGREEMFLEGESYGQELGSLLGTLYKDLYNLSQKVSEEKKLLLLQKLMRDILEYPLDNETDPTKEERLEHIKNRHRELVLLYKLESVSLSSKDDGRRPDISF